MGHEDVEPTAFCQTLEVETIIALPPWKLIVELSRLPEPFPSCDAVSLVS